MIHSLAIPKEVQRKFREEASGSGGDEVCGVLVGESGNLSGSVSDIRMVKNLAPKKEAGFIMDPVDFLNAIEDTNLYSDRGVYKYVGIIHSHYFDRPYPSIADWNGAANHGLYHGAYLIYSVLHEQLLAFYWNGNEFIKLELLL
jgi:proteasome lid subunit RPN8/RPN11